MIKKIFPLLLLSLCLACGEEHDSKLVGNWTGSEKGGQYENTTKSWIQNRYKDGTYETVFIYNQDCETSTQVETGKWWTDNGKFFEQEMHQKEPEVYTYELLNELNVRFKIVKSSGTFFNTNYSFVDRKLVHYD